MDFFQDPPRLGNQYDGDLLLRSWLERTLPEPVRRAIEPELREMGELAATTLLELSTRGGATSRSLCPSTRGADASTRSGSRRRGGPSPGWRRSGGWWRFPTSGHTAP